MSCRVDVRAVLYLYCLIGRLHKTPKLSLNIVFRHANVTYRRHSRVILRRIRIGLRRGVRLEPHLPERFIACLKTGKAMFLSFVEPKIASRSNDASVTEPLTFGDHTKWWIEAEYMKSCTDVSTSIYIIEEDGLIPQSQPSQSSISIPRLRL